MKLPLGGQRVRPMSVDILRDSANPRSQQRGSFKGKNDINKPKYNPSLFIGINFLCFLGR
ncbi:hypothetical protein RINTU1_11580 [Candidatus Regiella insecticola]|uniref:Uncharacterized protein n=1 Tax=Candidatus Regiella insecticola TaxID=138073 RepID=A0A6L2ZM56_9ENTR|nr:hypothetical protein RINTU1_11580 [Candidatus Regiella insecticola]